MPDDGASQNSGGAAKPSRYQRVQAILDQAQGPSVPSYQGYGKFWELPLPEFLAVKIYGVRMIAPATSATPFPPLPPSPSPAAPSCCQAASPPPPSAASCCPGSSPTPPAAQPGRGAASGLVIGLRGQSPFDDTQFPRLPWEGQAVSDADIRFISDWIDAGCPAEDVDPCSPIDVSESLVAARARGDEEHPLSDRPANHYYQDAGGVKVRKNINSLSWEELTAFRNAVAWMKSFNAYYQDQRSFGYWARIHANDCQHGWEEFLTWHRLYLYYFELELQGYDPTVTLPYWDWTDEYDPDFPATLFDAAEPDPTKTDNGVIPEAYRCWLTEKGWEQLARGGQVPAETLEQLKGVITSPPGDGGDPKAFMTFNSGLRLFKKAGVTYGVDKASDRAILTELEALNPLFHSLRWPGGDQALIFESYPSSDDVNRILQIANFFSFGSGPTNNHFFGALENVHNLIHNFSGGANPYYKPGTNPADRNNEPQYGNMVSAGVTAYDPIFWGHHSNVDRLWAEWESLHPGAGPDNLSAALPPFPLDVQQTLNVANFGYEYMKSSQVYPTSAAVPISRFKSAKTPVKQQVLDDHSRAEVRLHAVRFSTRAGFHIRVFLNSPDADEKTPLRGNPHYVGQINTFHGHCVGGPGHCEPPDAPVSAFDRRPRHRKTPGQYRIDATEAVRRLKAEGETAFQVNLVVLNTDGTLAHDALKLDAVSLNFME